MLSLEGALLRFPRGPVGPLSLRVPPGAVVGICGPTAAGKSVLLKLVPGLLRAHEGRVVVDGVDPATASPETLRELRGRIGMVFQNDALFDSVTVLENVAFPLLRRGAGTERAHELARRALDEVGLAAAEAKKPAQLSGGMKKRVGIARALVASPPIRLLDDPTAGLDPATTKRILELAASVHERLGGVTVIVGPDPAPLWPRCTLAVAMDRGRIVAAGAPGEVAALPEVHALFAPDRPEDDGEDAA